MINNQKKEEKFAWCPRLHEDKFISDISCEQITKRMEQVLSTTEVSAGARRWVDTKKQQQNGYNAEIVIAITYNTGTK